MKRQRGFTLLELVIAMTLTAMLLGMLSAGLYSVVNDWERENNGLDETLDKALVVLQLDRALQAAFPHSYIDREETLTQRIYFQGAEDSVSFVSAVSPQRQGGLMAWRLEEDDDGVYLKMAPAYADNPTERLEEIDGSKVLPGYSLELRYLLQENVDTKEWLEQWDGAERQSLPIAVHIVLTPDAQDDPDAKVLEIVAPIRAWRSQDIEPVTVVGS